jgi:hypothetical protein
MYSYTLKELKIRFEIVRCNRSGVDRSREKSKTNGDAHSRERAFVRAQTKPATPKFGAVSIM